MLIVRFGDFFGPVSGGSWFSQAMITPGKRLSKIIYPGGKNIGHAWAYLPDAGETIARLLDQEAALAPFARFHFGGFWDADGTRMTAAIASALGRPRIKVRPLPWWLLHVAGWFLQTPRELTKMRYLWKTPIRLNNRKLVEFLGAEPQTPILEAVKATLAGHHVT